MGIIISICLMIFILPLEVFAHKNNDYGQTYIDVHHNDSNYDVIDYLTYLGVVKGTGDGQFHPQSNVTNRQVALMLVRALKKQGMVFYENPGYKDVKIYDDGYKEIAIATQLGIFPKEEYFRPHQAITRDEMARALTRAFELNINTDYTFKDVDSNYWAHSYISTIASYNITTGYQDGTFRPKQTLTRSQFAAFVARALVPEIRPTNKQIKYNQGMMPSRMISEKEFINVLALEVEGYDYWEIITEKSPSREHWVTLGVDYYGNTKRLYEDTPNSFISHIYGIIELPYPLYNGKKWISGDETPGVTTTYTIINTQGIAVLPHKVYKDVVVINLEHRTDYGDYMPATLWFAKGHGFIRSMTGDGYSFLEEIEH